MKVVNKLVKTQKMRLSASTTITRALIGMRIRISGDSRNDLVCTVLEKANDCLYRFLIEVDDCKDWIPLFSRTTNRQRWVDLRRFPIFDGDDKDELIYYTQLVYTCRNEGRGWDKFGYASDSDSDSDDDDNYDVVKETCTVWTVDNEESTCQLQSLIEKIKEVIVSREFYHIHFTNQTGYYRYTDDGTISIQTVNEETINAIGQSIKHLIGINNYILDITIDIPISTMYDWITDSKIEKLYIANYPNPNPTTIPLMVETLESLMIYSECVSVPTFVRHCKKLSYIHIECENDVGYMELPDRYFFAIIRSKGERILTSGKFMKERNMWRMVALFSVIPKIRLLDYRAFVEVGRFL